MKSREIAERLRREAHDHALDRKSDAVRAEASRNRSPDRHLYALMGLMSPAARKTGEFRQMLARLRLAEAELALAAPLDWRNPPDRAAQRAHVERRVAAARRDRLAGR